MRQPAWGLRGAPFPKIGPLGEAFRSGFYGLYDARRGRPDSLQRKAWNAERRRSRAEPDLFVKKEC